MCCTTNAGSLAVSIKNVVCLNVVDSMGYACARESINLVSKVQDHRDDDILEVENRARLCTFPSFLPSDDVNLGMKEVNADLFA